MWKLPSSFLSALPCSSLQYFFFSLSASLYSHHLLKGQLTWSKLACCDIQQIFNSIQQGSVCVIHRLGNQKGRTGKKELGWRSYTEPQCGTFRWLLACKCAFKQFLIAEWLIASLLHAPHTAAHQTPAHCLLQSHLNLFCLWGIKLLIRQAEVCY